MDVAWDVYELYDPEVDVPLAELAPAEARRQFARLMAQRTARIDELRKLVGEAGIELDGTDESVRAVNEWFARHVEADPNDPSRLRGRWYSVVLDISLYLGELLIARHPHLEWRLGRGGRRALSFQRPVVVGFRNAHRDYDVDLDYAISVNAHDHVQGRDNMSDLFLGMLGSADEFA